MRHIKGQINIGNAVGEQIVLEGRNAGNVKIP